MGGVKNDGLQMKAETAQNIFIGFVPEGIGAMGASNTILEMFRKANIISHAGADKNFVGKERVREFAIAFQFIVGKRAKPKTVKTIFTSAVYLFVTDNRIKNIQINHLEKFLS